MHAVYKFILTASALLFVTIQTAQAHVSFVANKLSEAPDPVLDRLSSAPK